MSSVKTDLSRSLLIEEFVRNGEGHLSKDGALLVKTGTYTGRAAKDKYIVRNDASEEIIDWGDVNQPMSEERYESLHKLVMKHMNGRLTYVQNLSVGADPEHAMPLMVKTCHAYQSLFAKTLFRPALGANTASNGLQGFSLYCAPDVEANPDQHGTRGKPFIAINFKTREVLIGGTRYSGEIKKSIFTVMNTLLPMRGVMTMHAAANVGECGDSAIFFGLSGTGKTTLSSDPSRRLVGDDEHGWSENGIFNFEGGCYAKAIRLSPHAEPQIWDACHAYGTILENVDYDESVRTVNFDSDAITENTRAAYPLSRVPGFVSSGCATAPQAIVMLACDAFGVLPPVAQLTPEQAMYYFLSGYTAKVAGTEAGVTEPTTTFSACFGQPFMALRPTVYAGLLADKIRSAQSACYLINTGWWKGPYGSGERMPIALSRAIVTAAVSGALGQVPSKPDPLFGFMVPESIPGLSSNTGLRTIVQRDSWPDTGRYDEQSKKLAGLFVENFAKYAGTVADQARGSGPRM